MKVRWDAIPPEGREIFMDQLFPYGLYGPDEQEEHGLSLASAVKGALLLRRTPQGIKATGRISTAVSLECSRCLQDFILPIVSEFEEFFILKHHVSCEEDKELLHDDLDVSFIPEEGIEIRDIVEEQIWLNIPMKPLCHEGCKGLCSVCGMDLNVGECGCDRQHTDPRFTVLKTLRSSLP
jgi:uncharacterized protein